MEEVRSYWQVASITHFCSQFQKPFKLPVFEPEELEQAFIIDIPAPPSKETSNNHISNHNHIENERVASTNSNGEAKELGPDDEDDAVIGGGDSIEEPTTSRPQSPDYIPPPSHERFLAPANESLQQRQQQQNDEQQQELHLLVKLAIALLKPHFNSKISPVNWENYLGRLLDSKWVELENCPSPFHIPVISPEGIELTKNLSFNELPLSDKIDVFSALCDYRFWCDDASELIKDYSVDELRLESIGKDSQGYEYWYFSGTRLFRENKDLSQDLIFRKKRIKELEYKIVDLERAKILKEKEEKRKAELERAKQLASEAREARLAISNKKKKVCNTPVLPLRTGLRERRSSAASNNNETESTPARTLRSRAPKQQPSESSSQSQIKATRWSRTNKSNDPDSSRASSPDPPRKAPLEECREELEKLTIKPDERTEAWHIHCESLDEWENFAVKFEKTKSVNEKYLSNYINEYILPTIRAIYAKRAAEERRKERELIHSLATRRVSTRIISKRVQEEEQERLAQIRDAEIQKKKAEAEIRLRAELEREMKAKKNSFPINGQTSSACSESGDNDNGRYNLRQQQQQQDTYDSNFDGIIHPDKLSEFYEALELIIDTVRTSKHSWPFVDPVPETTPGYYDLIEEPMDLKKLRTKVEFRGYRSLIEIEKDFQLLVNNCEKYNGPKNVYTKMVYKLWKSFRKNVKLYLQRDLHMNEYETFIYPPAPPVKPQPAEELAHHNPISNGINNKRAAPDDHHGDHGDGADDEDHQDELNNSEHEQMLTNCNVHLNAMEHDNQTLGVKFEPEEPMLVDTPPVVEPKMQIVTETHILPSHQEQPEPLTKPTLQFQPTLIEILPLESGIGLTELPPEPIGEEVIVEMTEEQQCADKNISLPTTQDNSIVVQQNQ